MKTSAPAGGERQSPTAPRPLTSIGQAPSLQAGSPQSPSQPQTQPPSQPQTQPPSDLERLRGLLLEDLPQRLDGLELRLADPQRRTRDLAEVLPQAVLAGAAADGRLAQALESPVGQAIQRSVERDPQRLADALFPVMGPAIGRAIGESLKGLVQSINQAVEHSLSIRGLSWRIEAWRSGRPFAEVVLKSTLLYRVDAAYLIHNETGLPIDRAVAQSAPALKDEAAVSGMLTAIQDFVHDSFGQTGGALESAEVGGRTLWVLRGPRATLACAISGVPPQSLRTRLDSVLRDLHLAFAPRLAAFDGDPAPLAGVHPLIGQCLAMEYRDGAGTPRPVVWWPWLLAALGLAAGLGWYWWQGQLWAGRLAAARAELAGAPGIVLMDWEPGPQVQAQILADPLAADPRTLVSDPQVAERLAIRTRHYVSADPPIVLERARRQLAPPAGVTLALEGGVLRLQGLAPPRWIARVTQTPALPAGVDGLDLSALEPDHSGLLGRVRAAIEPPGGVELRLDGTALTLSGSAPASWIRGLAVRLARVEGLGGCDGGALAPVELGRARALAEGLAGREIRFGESVNPLPGAGEALDLAAAAIAELAGLDTAAGLKARVAVVGHSDGLGSEPWNQWLRRERAELIRRLLIERGAPAALLHAEPAPGFEPAAAPRPAERRVGLKVEIESPDPIPCWAG